MRLDVCVGNMKVTIYLEVVSNLEINCDIYMYMKINDRTTKYDDFLVDSLK